MQPSGETGRGGDVPAGGRGRAALMARTVARRTLTLGVFGVVAWAAGRRGAGDPVGSGPSADAATAVPRVGHRAGAPDGLGPAEGGPEPRPRTQLPRGGRILFPRYRLVGFSGSPGSPALGRLGIGDLDARAVEMERLATRYAAGRVGLPVFELITVIVQAAPGRDGLFRVRERPEVIDAHLAAARRHRGLLLLNVQPGRAAFLDEVRALDRWLVEPDVGLALDPEWAVGPGQVPGRVFGHTTGAVLDEVARHVSGIVREHDLPEKALVVHQLAPRVLRGLGALRPHPGVVPVKSVDGIGVPAAKVATWRRLMADLPWVMRPGFKLFYEEDVAAGGPLMTPDEVLALQPTPEYVLYE
jgi:hypothetical protein